MSKSKENEMKTTLKKSWMKEQLADESSLQSEISVLFNLANQVLIDLFFFGNFSDESFYGPDYENEFSDELKIKNIATIKLQEKLQISEEDSSEEVFTVWGFYRGLEKVYVKFYGFYSSYDGAECQGFKLVEPKYKVITVYE